MPTQKHSMKRATHMAITRSMIRAILMIINTINNSKPTIKTTTIMEPIRLKANTTSSNSNITTAKTVVTLINRMEMASNRIIIKSKIVIRWLSSNNNISRIKVLEIHIYEAIKTIN